MTNKGFTLVEVLAVIIMLSVLVVIAAPSVTSYMDKGKDDYITNLKNNISLTAKNFYTDNKDRLLNSVNANIYVTALELKGLNYITGDLKDSLGNDCSRDTYVVAVKNDSDYDYYTCLVCNGKNYFDEDEKVYCNVEQ